MGKSQTENWRLAAQVGQSALLFTPLGPAWKVFSYVASGFLINGFLNPKPDKPDVPEKSYGWKHMANQGASEGSAMPVIYGKVRVQPTIKNQFITHVGDKEYNNILYSFGCHAIDEITSRNGKPVNEWSHVGSGGGRYEIDDEVKTISSVADQPGATYVCTTAHYIFHTVKGVLTTINYTDTNYWKEGPGTAAISDIIINGNSITNHPEVDYTTRPGLAEQFVIEGFDLTYNSHPQDETCFFIPGARGSGIPDQGDWTTVTTTSTVTQNIELTFHFPSGLYGLDSKGNVEAEFLFMYSQYRLVGTKVWSNFAVWKYLKYSAGNPVHRVFDWPYLFNSETYGAIHQGQITAKNIDPFNITFKAMGVGEYLTPGQYEVRFGCNIDDARITNVATIIYGDFTYPGEPLLGIRSLANEDLNDTIDLRAVCERSTVDVYDYVASAWVKKSASIHAWAIYDMLCAGSTDHIDRTLTYGGGVSHTQLDTGYSEFSAWANYSSQTLGYDLNIVFDSFQELWNAILQVQQEGQGVVYPAGSEYHVVIDRAISSSHLVNVALTNLGSFRRQWFDKTRKANLIEVTYFDEDRGYEPTVFAVRTSDWDDQDRMSDPAKLVLYGTNNFNQAYGLAKYKLNCNALLNQIATAELDVDSLQIGIGDVIKVQHDIPDRGDGGFVFGTATSTIIFDKIIDFSASIVPLVVYLRRSDDVTYSLILDNPGVATDHADLKAGQSWYDGTPPAKYDPYIVGLADTSYKLYRVIDIARNERTMPRVTLLEYDADTYDPDTVPNLGLKDKTTFNVAKSLRAVEILSLKDTGDWVSSIRLSWDADQASRSGEWAVYFRDVDAGEINWTGNWATATVYSTYDKVVHDGNSYVSLIDNNTGLIPGEEPVAF